MKGHLGVGVSWSNTSLWPLVRLDGTVWSGPDLSIGWSRHALLHVSCTIQELLLLAYIMVLTFSVLL